MPWPMSQDYNEAIQTPAAAFTDADLKAGQVVCNAMGLPLPCSGNFADVYAVQSPRQKWAVKCFTREIPGIRERYVEISKYLAQQSLPFMVEFKFLDQGIRVRGQSYPVLKMHWVEGFALNQFVRQQAGNPAVLQTLGQMWVKMAAALRQSHLAHCDLQHGNVLMVPGAKAGMLSLRLVDYDGMCVPALELLKSIEVGHPNFQHPQRLKEATYNTDVDRFSHLVIYTALRAVAVGGPGLWQKFDNGDNLLFKQADLANPSQSAVFRELQNLPAPEVRKLVDALAGAAKGPIERTPLLEDLVGAGTAMARTTVPVERSIPPKAGRSKAPWIAASVAVALVALAAGAFFMLAGGEPKPTQTALVQASPKSPPTPNATSTPTISPQTEPKVAPKIEPKVEPKIEPKVAPKIEPKVETKTEPKVEPKTKVEPKVVPPIIEPIVIKEYKWTYKDGNQGQPMIRKDQGLAVLTSLCGHFAGTGEEIRVRMEGDTWTLGGQAKQFLWGTAASVELPGRPLFQTDVAEAPWKKGDQPVRLIRQTEGIGILASINGNLGPFGESNVTLQKDGYWYLNGQSATTLNSRAFVVRYANPGKFPGKVVEHAWNLGEPPVRLLKDGEGFCFLSGVGGEFQGGGEQVKVYLNTDGYWYLGGQGKQKGVRARAISVWLPPPPPEPTGAAAEPPEEPVAIELLPVPDAAEQAKAEKILKELFKTDYSKRSAADRQALARKLLEQVASAKDDPVGRFVCAREARDLAAGIPDPALAMTAVEALASEFRIDEMDMKAKTLEVCSSAPSTLESNRALHEAAATLLDQYQSLDLHDQAITLAKIAQSAAFRGKLPQQNVAVARVRDAEKRKADHDRLQVAQKTLLDQPDDPAANLLVGKHYLFTRGDAGRGVPLLGKGGDAKLKGLALKDLAQPTTAADQVALADAWYDVGEAEPASNRRHLYGRAAYWYQLALAGLTGLERTRVEKRLNAIELYVVEISAVAADFQLVGNAAAFSPNSRLILCSRGNQLRLIEAGTRTVLREFEGHSGPITVVGFTPDGKSVLSGGADRTIRLWDIESGQEVRRFSGHTARPTRLVVAPGSRVLLSAAFGEPNVRIWNMGTGQEIRQFSFFTGKRHVHVRCFSPDGRWVLSSGEDIIRWWDTESGKEVQTFSGKTHIYGAAVSPDGRNLLTCGAFSVRAWDIATARELIHLRGHTGHVYTVAFYPDGRFALSGGADRTMRLWDLTSGRQLRVFTGHTQPIDRVLFSPNGRLAASLGREGVLRVYVLDKLAK